MPATSRLKPSTTTRRYALYALSLLRKTVEGCLPSKKLRSSTAASTSPLSSPVMPQISNFLGFCADASYIG